MESIIIEIRAGAGGEEAAIFAGDLYNMYSKYANVQNWKQTILDSSPTEIGGIKQVIFEIKGDGVLAKLKNEGGVHRVQRVPKTEKSNRIHTSTASVAVLEKPTESDVTINPSDLKFDFFKASGAGGQNVNKRQTAIRITHVPTGLIVASQVERGLEENRRAAMLILQARLFEQQRLKADSALTQERRSQIGTSDRSEKIRTYNFPQDRITDHRAEKSWHNIEKIMNGHLEKIADFLQENLQPQTEKTE